MPNESYHWKSNEKKVIDLKNRKKKDAEIC